MTLTGLLRGEYAPDRGRARSMRRNNLSEDPGFCRAARAFSVVEKCRCRSPAGFREESTVRGLS